MYVFVYIFVPTVQCVCIYAPSLHFETMCLVCVRYFIFLLCIPLLLGEHLVRRGCAPETLVRGGGGGGLTGLSKACLFVRQLKFLEDSLWEGNGEEGSLLSSLTKFVEHILNRFGH